MCKYYYIIFLFVFFIVGCANIVPPSGGEGIKTIPIVEKCSIKNAETNYIPKDIIVEFNSYMNRASVAENLQISPTIKYSVKWNAKKITITFLEELRLNTTYSISLSGKYSDYYGNISDTVFHTCFSTGDIIDSCLITGRIHTSNAAGYYIFCYRFSDTIDFLKDAPDYKILAGGNGSFVVPALKDGKYIVLAVKDIDKDGMITQGKDSIGVPQYISEIVDCSSKYIELIPNYVINPSQNVIDTLVNIDTNTTDTLQIDTSEIIDTNIYLHINGNIVDTSISKNRYLILTHIEKKIDKQVKINDDNTFFVDGLLAGEYEIFYFLDENENEVFDGGSLIPFELSEPFKKIEQRVKLNSRWSLDNCTVNIK